MEKRNIFTALPRNVNKENNVAEQYLIDMLCMSGFNRDDEWGFRALGAVAVSHRRPRSGLGCNEILLQTFTRHQTPVVHPFHDCGTGVSTWCSVFRGGSTLLPEF